MISRRDTSIDILRSILIFAMILAHVCSLLGDTNATVLSDSQAFGNLVCYSGFMFCFGYVGYTAYLSNEAVSFRRIFPSVYRPLVAYLISGICYYLIIDSHPVTAAELFKLLIFTNLPPLSEFLVGFSLTLLVAALFAKPIRWATETPRRFLVCAAVLLATTLIPYQIFQRPQFALFFGSDRFSFPVLQYFVLFLLGAYFARHQVRFTAWLSVLTGIGVLGFWTLIHTNPDLMRRFPPSVGFILGSTAFVLALYAVSRQLNRVRLIRQWLTPIGANTLFFLLLSNLMLFGLSKGLQFRFQTVIDVFMVTSGIVATIYFCLSIMRHVKVEPAIIASSSQPEQAT